MTSVHSRGQRSGGFVLPRWALAGGLLALFVLLILASGRYLPSAHALCQAEDGPHVITDEQEYMPGAVAQIDGCGFESYDGLDLTIRVIEPDGYTYLDTVHITAGGFTYNYTVPNKQGLYKVEIADGSTVVALTSFFDAHHVDPTSLTFVTVQGSSPPSQMFQFIGPKTCSDGTVTDNQTWISTSPAGAYSASLYTTKGTTRVLNVTVSISSASLAVGTYTGTATVDATGSDCDPAKSVSITLRVIQPNPTLPQSCGMDIVLVIDSSGSIDSTELSQMKTALNSYVSAFLPGTPTEIAVVEFDTSATVTQGFTSSASTLNTAINAAVSGGNTNWDDAIYKARSLFPNRVNPDLMVFASDGNPNRRGGHTALGHSATITSVTESVAMDWAIEEANAAKSAGIRVVGLGIGSDLNVLNMEAISGTNVSPPSAIDSSVDVITTKFSTLAGDLASLANNQCGTATPTKTNTPPKSTARPSAAARCSGAPGCAR